MGFELTNNFVQLGFRSLPFILTAMNFCCISGCLEKQLTEVNAYFAGYKYDLLNRFFMFGIHVSCTVTLLPVFAIKKNS